MIHHGDCVDVMAGMEPESVDAIVTDPPYGLEFMGKSWDRLGDVGTTSHAGPNERDDTNPYGRTRVAFFGSANVKCRKCDKWQWDHVGRKCECAQPDFPNRNRHQGLLMQAWHEAWAREALRVAKPGAYLLAFGGTRTVHRLACAIEDAGWIIRDTLVWAYAQGFPKSKASLKPAWEPIVMARKPGPLRELAIDACRIGMADDDPTRAWGEKYGGGRMNQHGEPYRTGMFGEGVGQVTGTVHPLGRWPANVILTDPIFDGGIEGVVGGGEASTGGDVFTPNQHAWMNGGADPFTSYGDSGTYSRFFALPITIGACRYCGVRIADGSSQDNPTLDTTSDIARERASSPRNSSRSVRAPSAVSRSDEAGENTARPNAELWDDADAESRSDGLSTSGIAARSSNESEPTTPRIPRNRQPVTSQGSTSAAFDRASRAAQSETSSDTTTITPDRWMCASCADLVMRSSTDDPGFAERPDSPRFLLIPKADRSDREPVITPAGHDPSKRFSNHPTVKPTELMRHLVRLVTPVGGVILDPFAGSGSTLIAAEQEGFEWIGIEKEAEYVAIAEARLNGTQRGLGLSA